MSKLSNEECEAQCHPGQELFETCKRCGGEAYPWSGHTDPTPWILRHCEHVAWPERRRGPWDELMNDPCWGNQENSIDRAPRTEYWTERGRQWHAETTGEIKK